MSFEPVTHTEWKAFIADKATTLDHPGMAEILTSYTLIPAGLPEEAISQIHRGSLRSDTDFTPASLITVIDGDLDIAGRLSTVIEGWDGNATLIVLGNLTCHSLNHAWASLLFVTGDVVVRDWVFASREDSSFVVGGDFTTPLFVGADIWVAVGGQVDIDYGYGYAVPLSAHADARLGPRLLPRHGWKAMILKLGFSSQTISDEVDLLEALEARLYETATLLP